MLQSLLDRTFQTRAIRVRLPDGRELTAGPGEPELTAVITDMKTALAIGTNPDLALGEAFMDGTFRVEGGDIYDFLQLASSQTALRPRSGKLSLLQRIRRGAEQANDRRHARSNVHHHYDLTVDFYRLFLDEDLQYSCAFFETPDATLEQAQVAKKRRLIDKLLLSPGQTALDIGCGWGGLGLSLAERGARVTGVTLSTEQHRTANERAAARGLSGQAEFRLQDYRDLSQTFDRIVSVGMFEHVGVPNYDEYFQTVARLLDDDGVAVIHSIGRKNPPGAHPAVDPQIHLPRRLYPAPVRGPAGHRAVGPVGHGRRDPAPALRRDAEALAHPLPGSPHRGPDHVRRAVLPDVGILPRLQRSRLPRASGHMVFQLQLTKKQTAVPLSGIISASELFLPMPWGGGAACQRRDGGGLIASGQPLHRCRGPPPHGMGRKRTGRLDGRPDRLIFWPSGDFDPVAFDDRVGQQRVAHALHLGLGGGRRGRRGRTRSSCRRGRWSTPAQPRPCRAPSTALPCTSSTPGFRKT